MPGNRLAEHPGWVATSFSSDSGLEVRAVAAEPLSRGRELRAVEVSAPRWAEFGSRCLRRAFWKPLARSQWALSPAGGIASSCGHPVQLVSIACYCLSIEICDIYHIYYGLL